MSKKIETTETGMPLTAADALSLWDEGGAIAAFQVEGRPERQKAVYAAAFELIRHNEDHEQLGVYDNSLYENRKKFGDLEQREFEIAHSIAYVALKEGWAKMVSQHIHRDSPAITISKG